MHTVSNSFAALTHCKNAVFILCSLLALAGCESQEPEITPEKVEKPAPSSQRASSLPHPPESSVYADDGVLIRYDERGSGPSSVVLVHGWNCDRDYWQLQRDDLAESYRVISIDLAGHGESGANRENWSVQAFGGDVAAVVKHLELENVVLVGHSMGGSVILAANRIMPERVRRLVVVDALRNPDQESQPAMLSATLDNLRADYSATVKSFVSYMFIDSSPPRVRDFVIRDMAQSPPAAGIGSLIALSAYDPMQDLRGLKTPVTLINSDFRPTNTELFERELADFTFVPMSDVGHFLMLEDPQTFYDLLLEAIAAPAAVQP